MIIDAFLAHNERELFDLRVEILKDIVDLFLVVEGDRTFRGKPRIPFFHGGDGPSDRVWVKTYMAELPENAPSPWWREYAQRNAMKRAVLDLCAPDDTDVVMLSDIDEIPDPACLEEAIHRARIGQIVCLKQIHTYFSLNLWDEEPWFGTRVLSWKRLRRLAPQDLRLVSGKDTKEPQHLIEHGGWHFGWTGDNQQIREKLAAFSHEELDREELTSDSYLYYCRKVRKTLHNQHQLKILPVEKLPEVVRKNQDRYKNMMVSEL